MGIISCPFIRWIETNGQALFLTDREVYSPLGRSLFTANRDMRVLCHPAIRLYFGLTDGKEHSARVFSGKSWLPPEMRVLHPEKPTEFMKSWGRMWRDEKVFDEIDLQYILNRGTKPWQKKADEELTRRGIALTVQPTPTPSFTRVKKTKSGQPAGSTVSVKNLRKKLRDGLERWTCLDADMIIDRITTDKETRDKLLCPDDERWGWTPLNIFTHCSRDAILRYILKNLPDVFTDEELKAMLSACATEPFLNSVYSNFGPPYEEWAREELDKRFISRRKKP